MFESIIHSHSLKSDGQFLFNYGNSLCKQAIHVFTFRVLNWQKKIAALLKKTTTKFHYDK